MQQEAQGRGGQHTHNNNNNNNNKRATTGRGSEGSPVIVSALPLVTTLWNHSPTDFANGLFRTSYDTLRSSHGTLLCPMGCDFQYGFSIARNAVDGAFGL